MSKFSKFIFLSALTGAAAYGAYSYLRKEEVITPITEDEETTSFDEDLEGEPTSSRSYINLTFNKEKAEDLAKNAVKKARETFSDSVQKVEEFFNDEILNSDSANENADTTEADSEAVNTKEDFFSDNTTDEASDSTPNEVSDETPKSDSGESEEATSDSEN